MKLSKLILVYWFTVGVWAITVLIKLKYNGLVFGFDYGLFHPDGTLYSTRALDWAGYSEVNSAKLVSDWYNSYSYKFNNTSPADFYYSNNAFYSEYSTRILYPLLSVPWIKLLGIPGLLVVPALSLLVLMLVLAKIGVDSGKSSSALLVIILVSSSPTVSRWMLVNTTDALLVGIFSITALYLNKKNPFVNWYLEIIILIILSSMTRFSFLFWLAIAAVQVLDKKVKRGIFIFIMSILAATPTVFTHNSNSFLAVEGARPLLEKLLLYPLYLFKVIFYEFAQLFVLDRVLFFMCVLSIYFAIKNFEKISSKYLACFFMAGFLTGALNGTVGVNFRYQLPVLVFIGWSLIDNTKFSIKNFSLSK